MYAIYNHKIKDWLREGAKQVIAAFRTRSEAVEYLEELVIDNCDCEILALTYPFLEKTHFCETED